ncbi:uncharacterized protein LOC103833729 [Brassica rapa]|uniref:uncharacterized protein LOC103833729 n=1 Tax=Brassica campestris TaxID=3711 RepID=UPI00142DBBE2|nr:uncharacterized protein LOC103833729 [Brassica rapa]
MFWVINTSQKHSWLVNKLLDAREIIYPWIRQRVQNSETTYFWSTKWSPYGKLSDYLQTVGAMRLPVTKNATIAEQCENGAWVVPNARSDRQLKVISYLTTLSITDYGDEPEWWPGDQKQPRFQTGKIYDLLRPSTPTVSWHREVWFSGGIPKHMFLVWLMVRNRCPTGDRIMQWQTILHQLQQHSTNKVHKTLLLLCWQATLYTLWTERNNRLHNAQYSSSDGLVLPDKANYKKQSFQPKD